MPSSDPRDCLADEGPLSDKPRAEWSPEVEEHVQSCHRCQAFLRADRLLHLAAGLIRESPPLPPLDLDELRSRRLDPIPLEVFEEGLNPFPPTTIRGPNPLDLLPTERGVRVWDPQAREVSVFLILKGGRPVLLDTARSEQPGVGLEVEVQPEKPATIVAVSTYDTADPLMWQHWLSDHLASGAHAANVSEVSTSRVRMASTHLRSVLPPSRLHTQADPLPPSTEAVRAQMHGASTAGMGGDVGLAAVLYQGALSAASQAADGPGIVRSTIGLSTALRGLGFDDDADDLLTNLASTSRLDPRNASRLCQTMARSALWRGDLTDAERWSQELEALPQSSPMTPLVCAQVAAAIGDEKSVWKLAPPPSELPEASRHTWSLIRSRILADVGMIDMATEIFEAQPAALAPLQICLEEERARLAIASGIGGPSEHLFQRLVGQAGTLPQWDLAAAIDIALRCFERGHGPLAHQILSAALAGTDRRPWQLLAVRVPRGVLIAGPDGVRRLPLAGDRLIRLIRGAREEVEGGALGERVASLGALLFPRTVPERIEVWSDGVLSGAPIAAAMSAIGGLDVVPIVEHRVLRRPGLKPANKKTVSLADPFGDLPFASREFQGGDVYREHAAVRSVLHRLDSVGLLHIGVHCRREGGMPVLLFADGPLSPAEISVVELKGNPLVFLAGCATGTRVRRHRAERSLARSFLLAGASGVIGTHWPVEDRGIHSFVQRFEDGWPVDGPAAAVARIATALRLRGASPKLWAAPVYYQ